MLRTDFLGRYHKASEDEIGMSDGDREGDA